MLGTLLEDMADRGKQRLAVPHEGMGHQSSSGVFR